MLMVWKESLQTQWTNIHFSGDIAFRFLNYIHNESSEAFELPTGLSPSLTGLEEEEEDDSDNAHVTVCDINQAMLDVGKKRAENMGLKSGKTKCETQYVLRT